MLDSSRLEPRPPPSDGTKDEEAAADPWSWTHSRLARSGLLVLLAAAASFLISHQPHPRAVVYRPGDIARADVKASLDFFVEDSVATERARREAENAVPVVYDYDPGAVERTLATLDEELKIIRSGGNGERSSRRALEERWGFRPPPELMRLLETGNRPSLEAGLRAVLAQPYLRGVVANRDVLLTEEHRGVVVRNLSTREERPFTDPSAVEDYDEAKHRLMEARSGKPATVAIRKLAAALLRPNLSYNGEETASRRAEARKRAKPVLYEIRRGEMLVREGDRVSPAQAQKLAAHAKLAGRGDLWHSWAGVFLLSLLLLYAAYDFGRSNIKKFRYEPRDLAFLGTVLVLWLVMERVGLHFAAALGDFTPSLPRTAVVFALPLASAIMVVRAVINSETALIFAVPFCALACLPSDRSLAAFFYLLTGGLIGAHRAARACRRSDFIRAGIWMGLAQGAAAWALGLLEGWAFEPQAATIVLEAAGAGIIGGFLALSVVPLAETIFGYTTDMRLMELASLDHPLLRDLMVRAPGTYHHSIVTGTLVKAAAEAIGAKALLAAVAAYYHDVGKISKPSYFVENQSDGGNRHEKLRPSMSSLILMSHVKEGVELARKHRLGRDIVAIIRQHHGTSLIQFFYDKACQSARPGLDEVHESEYRYPGPKPRTREAALVLLADAVEAAARTVTDPRPARIHGLVQNLVNRIFSDGQLDECDLTLKDLHEIARSFSRILTGIHHQRIDYPLAAQKERRAHGDLDPERRRGSRDRRGEAGAQGPESLRRLGL